MPCRKDTKSNPRISYSRSDMFDLVVVGHLAIDLISSPRIALPKPTLGGPPTYVSLAASKLDTKVSIISKVGEDFPNAYFKRLNANGVDLSGLKYVKNALTTRFALKYRHDGRQLQLVSRAPPITLKDIPSSLEARAIHVAPIADELTDRAVSKLRTLTATLSLDPQGFVRRFGENGNAFQRQWDDRYVLGQIDIYKSSLNEIRVITGLTDLRPAMEKIRHHGVGMVIVTMGRRGAAFLYDKKFYEIPACEPRVFLDSTGAGDAFTGAFLAEYIRGKDTVWCICVGSAAASFVVEGVGPEVFGEKKNVYERAAEIHKAF